MVIHFSIAIQAGGQSTHMGRDKGLIHFRGKPLTQHILDQLVDFGNETFIITNSPVEYQQFSLPVFTDVYPGMGALGGLYTAIYHAAHEYCLVLACDMPFINRPLLDHIVSLAPNFDAVIPQLKQEDLAEPFRAIYKKTCLDPIKTSLEAGKLRVISFFDQLNTRFVDWSEIGHFDPEAKSFFNINTPKDFDNAQHILEL